MRRARAFLIAVIAGALTVTGVAQATPGTTFDIPTTWQYLKAPDTSQAAVDLETGAVRILSKTSNNFELKTSQWAPLPEGWSISQYSQQIVRAVGNGKVVAAVTFLNQADERSLWFSEFDGSAWSNWVNVIATGAEDWLVNQVYVEGDLHAMYVVSYQNGARLLYLASDSGGTWTFKKIFDSSTYGDLVYPDDPAAVQDQIDGSTPIVDYMYAPAQGGVALPMQNSKIALVGNVVGQIPGLTVSGNGVDSRQRYFALVMDAKTLMPVKRTYIGESKPYAYRDLTSMDGLAYNEYPTTAWWNKSGDNFSFITTRNIILDCPHPTGSLSEYERSRFIDGSCTSRFELAQYASTGAESVLATNSGKYGDGAYLAMQVVQTDQGMVGIASSYKRPILVDVNGFATGPVNDNAASGHKWVTSNSSWLFAPFSVATKNGNLWNSGIDYSIYKFAGIAYANYFQCRDTDADNEYCTMTGEIHGEGKTLKVPTGQVAHNGLDGWQDQSLIPSFDRLALFTSSTTYNADTQQFVRVGQLTGNWITPAVTKKASSLAKLPASSLGKGKKMKLPISSQQLRPVTWSVASKSKSVCKLIISRSGSTVTKVEVQGLKAGSCKLTAKTTRGYFYKLLNKTLTVKVK